MIFLLYASVIIKHLLDRVSPDNRFVVLIETDVELSFISSNISFNMQDKSNVILCSVQEVHTPYPWYLHSQWTNNDKICIFRFFMTQCFQNVHMCLVEKQRLRLMISFSEMNYPYIQFFWFPDSLVHRNQINDSQ